MVHLLEFVHDEVLIFGKDLSKAVGLFDELDDLTLVLFDIPFGQGSVV